jgi:hypothetical protein
MKQSEILIWLIRGMLGLMGAFVISVLAGWFSGRWKPKDVLLFCKRSGVRIHHLFKRRLFLILLMVAIILIMAYLFGGKSLISPQDKLVHCNVNFCHPSIKTEIASPAKGGVAMTQMMSLRGAKATKQSVLN